MTVSGIVTSASDIAAILDTVGPDKGTPLADTPIWNELAPRWAKMHRQFAQWEAEIAPADQEQPVQAVEEAPAPKPQPRKSSRGGPKSGPAGSSTRRAANVPQAPTEKPSEGTEPVAEPKENS